MTTNKNDDFIDLGLAPYLSKAEAVRLLDRLYFEHIVNNGLTDIKPDFRSLIDENIRRPEPPSSIKTGIRRGNRRKYGTVRHCRSSKGRVLFLQADLENWFYNRFAPRLVKEAV